MLVRSANIEHRNIRIQDKTINSGEHIVIDLHAGSKYYVPGDPKPISIEGPIKLKPGRCITVETKESIALPKRIFGTLHSKGKLSTLGIWVGNNKVDPLFNGQLNIPILNAGTTTFTINTGEPFCCVAFHLIETAVDSEEIRHAVQPTPYRKVSLYDRIKPCLPLAYAAIIAAISAIVGAGVTIWMSRK